jgi:hypothetical protein
VSAWLLCYRCAPMPFGYRGTITYPTTEVTEWASLAEALDASELGCGPICRHDHIVVFEDVDGRSRAITASRPEAAP